MNKERFSAPLLSEAIYNVRHLRQSFEQRNIRSDEAFSFVSSLKSELSHPNPYFQPDEKLIKLTKLAAGFFFSTFRFRNDNGEWVAKIGLAQSPMWGYSNPSSEEFTEWYRKNLEIQYTSFQEELPHLIPSPQLARHVKVGDKESTVVLQPFIEGIRPLSKTHKLPSDDRHQISRELDIFDRGVKEMQQTFGLTPDMLRSQDHFVIAPKEDGYHLVLLDNGLFDDHLNAPGMNLINRFTYKTKMSFNKSRFAQ